MKPYLYDPHVHTKESSKCGWIPAATIVETYHDRKYAGIAITDHMHETYVTNLDCKDDWDACVDEFLTGYQLAKKRGDELGMDIILGMEEVGSAVGNRVAHAEVGSVHVRTGGHRLIEAGELHDLVDAGAEVDRGE
jgi:histidinol phosphatase-like PHP family hydrolase